MSQCQNKIITLLLFGLLLMKGYGQTDSTKHKAKYSAPVFAEQMPEFPGGDAPLLAFFRDNIKVPAGLSVHGKEVINFLE